MPFSPPVNPFMTGPMDPQLLYYVLATAMILVGVAGVILPALPGLPLVFAGMLLAAWASDFERVGAAMLGVLGLLTLLSILVDFLSTLVGAQRVGASRKALAGTFVGTFAGLFFLPIGLLAGPFIGALLGELWHLRAWNWKQATRVGFGTWLGILLGTVLKLGLTFLMLALFLGAWLF